MVEGHSVHRVAARHRQYLLGRRFQATSPNGRFAAGAAAIHQQPYARVEAVGKNLFCFFGSTPSETVVVHVHFGMAGNWAIYHEEAPPEPRATTRLRLISEDADLVADLSAMTVQHGTMTLYESKREALGQDPLRVDAHPEALWTRVASSGRSIGALIMDQSFFTGPGNIYRAEILFKAGVHPTTPGSHLNRAQFDRIWHHTVALLRRGFETGSILTVDPGEAAILGSQQRRYIYNQSHCPRCQTRIVVWDINNRTCYACPTCQPKYTDEGKSIDSPPKETSAPVMVTPERPCEPFFSHCAPDSLGQRLQTPQRLTVVELRTELHARGVVTPKGLKKRQLVELLDKEISKTRQVLESSEKVAAVKNLSDISSLKVPKLRQQLQEKFGLSSSELKGLCKAELVEIYKGKRCGRRPIMSSADAALEKAQAGESLAVEHTAELAPSQARSVRSRIVQSDTPSKRKQATRSPSRRATKQPKV